MTSGGYWAKRPCASIRSNDRLPCIKNFSLPAWAARYYTARRKWLMSNYTDFNEARAAISAAAEVIQREETMANTHLDRRGLRIPQPLDNDE